MGKTTVSNYLTTAYRLPVLDADIYAREAVEPGAPILDSIIDRYGSGVLRADGKLDRPRLGEIVFNSSAERLWLEQQIHPYVRDRLVRDIQASFHHSVDSGSVIVLVIPLLFEARMTDLVTETWVVCCSLEQQLQRLVERDRLTPEQAQVRISSQMAIQKKVARADVVLDNSSTLEHLLSQVDRAMTQTSQKLTVPRS